MDIAMPRTSVRLRSFRRWVASAALAAAVAVPAAAFAQVVVIANGSPITAYDIEQRTKLIATSTHKAPTRQEVIQDLIDDRIKITKAKSYGFEVPDTEVDQAFANMAKNQHLSPQQLTQVLERAGLSPTTIKARVRFTSCNEGLAFSRALRDVAVREPISRRLASMTAALDPGGTRTMTG